MYLLVMSALGRLKNNGFTLTLTFHPPHDLFIQTLKGFISMKRIEQTGTVKQYDWPRLSKDLMEGLFLSQQELASLCKVSQQSISNWETGLRNPGMFAKMKLFHLAKKKKFDLSKYEVDDENTKLLELFNKMSKKNKIKFLQYGSRLVK